MSAVEQATRELAMPSSLQASFQGTAQAFRSSLANQPLLICHTELSLIALIGIILLIGIVKKNGIMMVDFALEAERKEGKGPADAIHEGCLIRFRPIMMTTMSALMATLPIALGFGAGASARRGLGIAVVGGLLFSQLITLYLTPVVYVALDRFQAAVRLRLRGKAAPAAPQPQ